MKDGYKTSEFYVTTGVLIAGFLVHLGVLSPSDLASFSDGWAQTVKSVFTLLAQAGIALAYLYSRHLLKRDYSKYLPVQAPVISEGTMESKGAAGFKAVALLMALLTGLLFAGPALAQCPCPGSCPCPNVCPCPKELKKDDAKKAAKTPAATPAPIPAYVLPWRAYIHGQLNQQNQTDPQVAALLQQQIQLHQQQVFLQTQLLAFLQAHGNTPAPQAPAAPTPQAPPPGPIAYHIYVPGPAPLQSFPIQGAPKQDFPIQGAPKQDFPIQGAPKQDLPIAGTPRQSLPIQGGPLQSFPLTPPVPAPQAPASPAPAAPTPQTAPASPAMPPAMPPATTFQRFTHAIAD